MPVFHNYKNSYYGAQAPRKDFGNARVKKVLNALGKGTKANSQENISGKIQLQKKWGGPWPPCPLLLPPAPLLFVGGPGVYNKETKQLYF